MSQEVIASDRRGWFRNSKTRRKFLWIGLTTLAAVFGTMAWVQSPGQAQIRATNDSMGYAPLPSTLAGQLYSPYRPPGQQPQYYAPVGQQPQYYPGTPQLVQVPGGAIVTSVPVIPPVPAPQDANVNSFVPDPDLQRQLAEQLGQYGSASDAKKTELRSQITKLVDQQFEAKHQHQAKRLEELASELQSARQTLAEREKNKQAIVERRVNELLQQPDPLGWDAGVVPRGVMRPAGTSNNVRAPTATVYGYPQNYQVRPAISNEDAIAVPPAAQGQSFHDSSFRLESMQRAHTELVTAGLEYLQWLRFLESELDSQDTASSNPNRQRPEQNQTKTRFEVERTGELWNLKRRFIELELSGLESELKLHDGTVTQVSKQLESRIVALQSTIKWAKEFQNSSIDPLVAKLKLRSASVPTTSTSANSDGSGEVVEEHGEVQKNVK